MRLLVPLLAVLVSTVLAPSLASAATCGERLAFVRKIIDHDIKIGFIGKDVYAAMSKDLDSANAACQSGQDAKAQLLISSTQSRHGYPVR